MALYEFDGKRPFLPPDGDAWVAPSAELIGDVHLGAGAGIWFGTVIRADNTPIIVGPGSNVQEQCMLHSDPGAPLTIGADVTVGHQVILHGCTIGDTVLVGMGATIMNNAVIGAESIVGAGALITEGKNFPPRSMILGAPAKVVRQVREEEVEAIRQSAAGYLARGRAFRAGLRPCE